MRTRYFALLAAVLTVALALIPLTAGGQSDGRDEGAQPGAPASPEAPAGGEAFTGWDGDGPVPRTLVHSGDSTIQGGLCVGFDCSSNEPMGFATIKIEENNLRIAAADSSSVSGFPTRDWQIEFNSSSSGGGNYFMVRDCGNGGAGGSVDSTCGGTPMLTIEGGADNESIHVDSAGNQGGNVGFGTANPVVDLHALSGNTPTLRLEQDNSSGFTPQSWDMAGNESNFFIRDVTNGSALPFRIEPGTASNTLYLDNNEGVGIATSAPTAGARLTTRGTTSLSPESVPDIHIMREGTGNFRSPMLRLEDTDTGIEWDLQTFSNGNSVGFRFNDGGSTPFVLTSTGGLTISGTLTEMSDVGAKTSFAAVDAQAILDKIAGLSIAEWSYRSEPGVRHIGPSAQDFYDTFALGSSRYGISAIDRDGVALAAIQALYAQNVELKAQNDVLAKHLASLEARLVALGG